VGDAKAPGMISPIQVLLTAIALIEGF